MPEPSDEHPTKEALARFVRGRLPEEEQQTILRHLLTSCVVCQRVTRTLWVVDGRCEDGENGDDRLESLPTAASSGEAESRNESHGEAVQTLPEGPIDGMDRMKRLAARGEPRRLPEPEVALSPRQPASLRGRAKTGASTTWRRRLPMLVIDGERPGRPERAEAQEQPERLERSSPDRDERCAPREARGYDEVLDRVFDQIAGRQMAIAQERTQGQTLHAELLQHPVARRRILVSNSQRFRSRSLCEQLLLDSHEAGFREPVEAVELAGLAVQVASSLDAACCGGSEMLFGLRARAWAQLGNALRISSDHSGAERAFATAHSLLRNESGVGLLDRARVLDLRASLLRDQRRFDRALRLLDQVILIYRKLGQTSLLGRALNQKAIACDEAGDGQSALALLQQAAEILDPNDDLRWYVTVRHNLINSLNDAGRSREAFALLFHTRPLYLKLGDRMNLLRLRWLEGQVARGLERLDQAELAFREVREAFIELQIDYDAALVSLELAEVYLRQLRLPEAKQLAEETLAVFQSRDIHREAMAALSFFCTAARTEQAGAVLAQEVSGYLKKARNNPDLRFRTAYPPEEPVL